MKQEIKEMLRKLKSKYFKENSEEKYQVKLRKLIDSYKSVKTTDEIEKFKADAKKLKSKLKKKREIK
jgi:hypothetical protein